MLEKNCRDGRGCAMIYSPEWCESVVEYLKTPVEYLKTPVEHQRCCY